MKNLVILATFVAVLGLYALELLKAPSAMMCGPVAQNVLRCEPAK